LAELRIRMGGKVWQVQRYHGIPPITLLKKTQLQEMVKPYGARYTTSQRTEQGKKALYIVVWVVTDVIPNQSVAFDGDVQTAQTLTSARTVKLPILTPKLTSSIKFEFQLRILDFQSNRQSTQEDLTSCLHLSILLW
jgi:hypothetical protein